MASVAASATSAETSFSSPNRLSQMLPSTADNSNSELMVTRSPTGGAASAGHFHTGAGHFYGGSDHNVMRHSVISRNPNAVSASVTAVFEDYDDLNLSSELDASFGEKGRIVHPQSIWQAEGDCGSSSPAAAPQQSCWV